MRLRSNRPRDGTPGSKLGVSLLSDCIQARFHPVDHVRDRFFELLGEFGAARRAVYFLGAVPLVDMAGAEFLAELHGTLAARGIELCLAGTPSSVRETLVRAGFERHCGPVVANEPVAAVVVAPSTGQSRAPMSSTI